MDASAKQIRKNILKISHHSGHGHIPSCFSVVELILGVYQSMRHRPNEPDWCRRDIFVLSKGHAALGYYCVLAHAGYFAIDEVFGFGAFGSEFGCHADRLKVPGVEVSTGSLGHGLGVAVGMAMGFKVQACNRRVLVLIGDGEANEGAVWEAIMIAVDQRLDNLTVLYDSNNSQSRCLDLFNPEDRFKAFGCEVKVIDGHDLAEVKTALSLESNGKPNVVVSKTVKGYGCRTLVNDIFAWHRRSPNSNELEQLLGELDESR